MLFLTKGRRLFLDYSPRPQQARLQDSPPLTMNDPAWRQSLCQLPLGEEVMPIDVLSSSNDWGGYDGVKEWGSIVPESMYTSE